MKQLIRIFATAGDSGESRFLVLMGVMAFLTGAARAVLGRNHRTRWYDVLAAAIVSGVVGSSVGAALLYVWGTERVYLIFPLCSISGWLGLALMDFFGGVAMSVVKRKVHAEIGDRDNA